MVAGPQWPRWLASLLSFAVIVCGSTVGFAGEGGSGKALHVEPTRIPIGLFYDGAELRVDAVVPAGQHVAIAVEGPRSKLELKLKGRVFGLVWMSVRDLVYEDLPSAYFLATSAPLGKLATPPELDRVGLGYPALAHHAGGDAAQFGEAVKLKESEGLYRVFENSMSSTTASDGAWHFAKTLAISAKVPPGRYTVDLWAFSAGSAVKLGSSSFTIEQVGAPEALHVLAMDHGLLYGISAVLIAIVAGLLTGVAFGGKSDKAH